MAEITFVVLWLGAHRISNSTDSGEGSLSLLTFLEQNKNTDVSFLSQHVCQLATDFRWSRCKMSFRGSNPVERLSLKEGQLCIKLED